MYLTDNALGLSDNHIVALPNTLGVSVHKELLLPLQKLQMEALKNGFKLAVASGFRSFERQQAIWDAKARGLRPVLSACESPIDITGLSEFELIRAIMHWSALPGGSRHHWGSEIDIYDASALGEEQSLQLTLCEAKTLFTPFYTWLEDYLKAQPDLSQGFFRPYTLSGLVAFEPWHLSYRPVAEKYEKILTMDILRNQIKSSSICLRESVLSEIEYLYRDYIEHYFAHTSP